LGNVPLGGPRHLDTMDDSQDTGLTGLTELTADDSQSTVAPGDHRATMKALDVVQNMLGGDGQVSRR